MRVECGLVVLVINNTPVQSRPSCLPVPAERKGDWGRLWAHRQAPQALVPAVQARRETRFLTTFACWLFLPAFGSLFLQ